MSEEQDLVDIVACVIHRELPHADDPRPNPNCYACRVEAAELIEALRDHGLHIDLKGYHD